MHGIQSQNDTGLKYESTLLVCVLRQTNLFDSQFLLRTVTRKYQTNKFIIRIWSDIDAKEI